MRHKVRWLVGAAMLAGSLSLSPAANASARGGLGFSLPRCAMTLVPNAYTASGAKCLRALPAGVSVLSGPQMTLSENGPWGSQAWLNGEHINVIYYGYQELPSRYNDWASAWQTYCSAGYVLKDHDILGPGGYVDANQHGNFPWGGVGNDQLSAVSTFQPC